ncbi:hypothetical protein ACJQWK_03515 [Exserohilum turcicum]
MSNGIGFLLVKADAFPRRSARLRDRQTVALVHVHVEEITPWRRRPLLPFAPFSEAVGMWARYRVRVIPTAYLLQQHPGWAQRGAVSSTQSTSKTTTAASVEAARQQ